MQPPVMNIEVNRRRRLVRLSALTLALAVGLSVSVIASAQAADNDSGAAEKPKETPVNLDNFVRAATEI
jgi:hypothetical protein